jgi:hypothetical protein
VILLSWHQHPKVAGMKKEEKLSAWVAIVNRGKAPPSFEKWTDDDDLKLMEAQSDVVEIEMAHTALGHLEALKKKELVLAALTMTQEEFDKLAADRNELIFFFFLIKNVLLRYALLTIVRIPRL